MAGQIKPLHQQVIFITGATSGVGLSIIRQAAHDGAKVFMVAKNEDELQKIQDEMRSNDYSTAYTSADVAEFDQLQNATDRCLTTFGRIDTWINNAGAAICGKLMETTEDEARSLFDTNFWGMVNGCKIAVLAFGGRGGQIINVGSDLVKSVDPLQGIFSAAEHATKAYTDALRMELKRGGQPISVSLILPRADLFVSRPDEVASSILKCVVKPKKEVSIGVSAFINPLLKRLNSRLRHKMKIFANESNAIHG